MLFFYCFSGSDVPKKKKKSFLERERQLYGASPHKYNNILFLLLNSRERERMNNFI
jgi:hypothetical protein